MRRIFKILWLKLSVGKLNRKRREAILDIGINQPKEANRVNCIEDVNPIYFKEIDDNITSRERLISKLSRDAANRANRLSALATIFF